MLGFIWFLLFSFQKLSTRTVSGIQYSALLLFGLAYPLERIVVPDRTWRSDASPFGIEITLLVQPASAGEVSDQVDWAPALPAPARISPPPTTEQKQHQKNNQQGRHFSPLLQEMQCNLGTKAECMLNTSRNRGSRGLLCASSAVHKARSAANRTSSQTPKRGGHREGRRPHNDWISRQTAKNPEFPIQLGGSANLSSKIVNARMNVESLFASAHSNRV